MQRLRPAERIHEDSIALEILGCSSVLPPLCMINGSAGEFHEST